MHEAVKRFLDEMGAVHAEQGNRDVSPILFKADDEDGGKLFEVSLPKGESHPYWRVREREMMPNEIDALVREKKDRAHMPWTVGSTISDRQYKVRGYVYNARVPNRWNLSVDGAR